MTDEIPDLIPLPIDSTKDLRVIPVSILTGFLGSGKTTLLNHILINEHGKRIAVIENEFSNGLGIEKMIAKNGVDGSNLSGFFELNNGCICCTVKGDLVTTLEQLILHKSKFDYILIETTGVANPGPIISELWTDDGENSEIGSIRLDGVITIVDSLNLEYYLQSNDTAMDISAQIAFADRILLNKIDLITPEKIPAIEALVRSMNGSAEIRHTTYAEVKPEWVLDINGYSTTRLPSLQMFPLHGYSCLPCNPTDSTNTLLTGNVDGNRLNTSDIIETPFKQQASQGQSVSQHHAHSPPLPPTITGSSHSARSLMTCGIAFSGNINIHRLKVLLDRLLYSASSSSMSHTYVVNVNLPVPPIPVVYSQETTTAVDSLGINNDEIRTPMDVPDDDETNAFEMKIYRIKGVIHVEYDHHSDSDNRLLYIVQAVHEVFDVQPSSVTIGSIDDSTNGMNKLVVIGRYLDANFLQNSFESCLI